MEKNVHPYFHKMAIFNIFKNCFTDEASTSACNCRKNTAVTLPRGTSDENIIENAPSLDRSEDGSTGGTFDLDDGLTHDRSSMLARKITSGEYDPEDEDYELPSPLREAKTYHSMDDIPSILLEEVVLPGSPLQKQMSMRLQDKGIGSESNEDECIICLEAFDDTNPRMPTTCGCGENKTYFHLPCLYQWVERSKDCPSCRKKLDWIELQ